MLSWLSGFRPHSSPDPFGATLPPGEGIFSLLSQRCQHLPHILLGAVVHHTDTHFYAGQAVFFDADVVVGGAETRLRVQAQVLGQALGVAFGIHK